MYESACMKAHVVKGRVFVVVFPLSSVFARPWRGTAVSTIVLLLFLPVAFVSRPGAARDVVSL